MTPLTDVLTATTQGPSPELSDEEVPNPKGQDMATSDTPDRQVNGSPYYERQLGESEVSYYLQSRATGVNDMFVIPASRGPPFTYLAERQVSPFGIQVSDAPCASPQGTRCLGHIKDASPPDGFPCGNAKLRRHQICVCFSSLG
jgi:hypothetical protein